MDARGCAQGESVRRPGLAPVAVRNDRSSRGATAGELPAGGRHVEAVAGNPDREAPSDAEVVWIRRPVRGLGKPVQPGTMTLLPPAKAVVPRRCWSPGAVPAAS